MALDKPKKSESEEKLKTKKRPLEEEGGEEAEAEAEAEVKAGDPTGPSSRMKLKKRKDDTGTTTAGDTTVHSTGEPSKPASKPASTMDSPPRQTQSKQQVMTNSTGLTTTTARIGLKHDQSSSPSPTKQSTPKQPSNLSKIPNSNTTTTTDNHNTTTTTASPPPSLKVVDTVANSSGFAKFSSLSSSTPTLASLKPLASIAKSPTSATTVPSKTDDNEDDAKPKTFSFGSGKGGFGATAKSTTSNTFGAGTSTFGTGASAFGTGASTFGSGSSTFGTGASTFGTGASTFGTSSKLEKDQDEEDDQDAHDSYLESLKKKYEIQEVVTGEEGEVLVASVRCKLFYSTPSSSAWKERGVGVLKLSQMEDGGYRLVMRSDVVRKLILNVRIPPSMPLVVRNEKYIEFYAGESEGVGKFLARCKNGQVTVEFYEHVRSVCPKPKEEEEEEDEKS